MTEKEKNEKLVQDNLTILLEEFSKEQQIHNQVLRDLKKAVESMPQSLTAFFQQQRPNEIQSTSVGHLKLQKTIRDTMLHCYQATKSSQKVVRQLQIQLFPEKDAKLFYRIVFGRWFLMLIVLFTLSYLYKYCIHQSDNNLRIELKKEVNARYKKAWDVFYEEQNTKDRRKMDRTWESVSQSEMSDKNKHQKN